MCAYRHHCVFYKFVTEASILITNPLNPRVLCIGRRVERNLLFITIFITLENEKEFETKKKKERESFTDARKNVRRYKITDKVERIDIWRAYRFDKQIKNILCLFVSWDPEFLRLFRLNFSFIYPLTFSQFISLNFNLLVYNAGIRLVKRYIPIFLFFFYCKSIIVTAFQFFSLLIKTQPYFF